MAAVKRRPLEVASRRLGAGIVIKLEDVNRDFEGMSWDDHYRHFARMKSEFLRKAHGLMAPGV